MPNDQKPIKSSITRKQNLDNKPLKKAGDGTMGFMLWSIAGTVLAACSSPIFSDVADLTGGGGSSGDTQGGSPGFVTNGRWANTDIYVADENGTRDPNADAVGITDGAGNIIFNDEYINLDTLGNGERYMADLEGATEISTGRRGMSGEELLSLPYHGGVLIISPLTDLLANAYIETAPQDMTREEFYQVTLDEILGQRPQFDTAGVAIAGTESSVVTVEDVLNADNYNPFADNNIAAELVSLASTTLGLIEEEASSSTTTERVAALTNSLDDTRGQLMTEADEDVLSFTLDSDSSIRGIDDLDGDVNARVAVAVARGGLPVVGTPNGGEAIPMTEGENFVLSRANSNPVLLFGFEDPFDNDVDGQPGGEREPGQLVGIYIEAASMGGDIAVMFGDATNNVALAGADRVAASDAAIPAMTTVGGVTFYFVSEANLDRLVLRPTDGDFNTADESVNNPQIRFYVHDGEHATLADGATTLDGVGMLEIEVANVNDAPVVTDPGTALITSTSDSDLSGTFTASDIDGDTDFRWSATPTSTPYGEFSFPDPANPGAWTFTLNEAAFDALPAGMDVPLTFDITANDGNGGVSDAATLTIMLQGQNDAPTDITTSVAALTASYDHDGIPSNGIFIATLSTVDADTGDTHTYTRGGMDGQYFSIRDGNGVISTEGTHLWLDNDAPGRAVGGTWQVAVTSTDSANAATSKTFSITRTDASTNLAPTDITTTATGTSAALTATYDGNNVPDGGNGGHVVATLGTTDPNTGDTHTYSIVPVTGEASELFDINGNELILSVSASPAPGDMLEVTVRSTDAGGLMVDKTFTITRAGNADTATDTLAIASEGARTHLLIYGVEFRALEDGASGGHIFFPVNDGGLEDVSETSDDYGIHASTYSQASIADIWNTDTDTDAVTNNNNGEIVRQAYVATIIEEMSTISAPAGNTLAGWRTVEPGGAPVNNEANGRRPFIVGTDEADLVVTEGTSDLTARGWLQVTGATGDITFSRAGGTGSFTASGQLGSAAHTDTREYTFAGDYGDLVIDGDGDWVYTLGGTTAQNEALAALQSGGTERFVVAAMETGGAMRTVTETISIIVNEAPAPLAVSSEGVRQHIFIYGVEFRALEDDVGTPAGIFFNNAGAETVTATGARTLLTYGIRASSFSQADIARIWNTDTTSSTNEGNSGGAFVATIIEEMSGINTLAQWRIMETGGAEVTTSNGFRLFTAGTDEADRVVTEGDDLTASGWLQVTGGTGDITYGNDATNGVTVTGQLGGASGTAAHTDTRTYTFVGDYGDLVIDGDGDWVYTLGGVANSANAATYQTNIDGLNSAGTETFEVEITRGGVTVDQDIMITVNIAADATALVVTNEAVRAFVIVNGVEFRVNTDGNAPGDQADRVFFSATSVPGVNLIGGRIGVWVLDTDGSGNGDYSQANIARVFNDPTGYHHTLANLDIAAIILEEDNTAFTKGSTHNFSPASTTLDDAVTEDDAADSTARGFLQVMGATDADTYTYTGGTTTVIGTGTNEVTYQIFDGDYGQLIVDVDGNWTYVIDNTRVATQALISGGTAAIDDFEVIVTQTAGTGTGTPGIAMIDITVNGANDAPVLDALTGAVIADSPDSATGSTVTTGALSGMFTATDADTADTHMFIAAVAGAGGAGAEEDATLSGFTHRVDGNYGMLFYNGGSVSDAEAAYRYVPNEAAINGLAHNALETESFEVTVTDGSATSAPRTLAFTIGGANEVVAPGTLVVTSQSTDTTVTEDDAADTTATGTLVVTDPPAGATYTYADISDGTYGDLTINAADGRWTYTIDNVDAQALDDGTTEDTITVTITEVIGGEDGRTAIGTITITVNGADEAPLTVESEGVREHILVYGVEFRAFADGNLPIGGIFFPANTGAADRIVTSGSYLGIEVTTYSQANIARIWNTDDDSNAYVATIIEEMSTISAPLGNTLAGWRTLEPGLTDASNSGTREFSLGTDEADREVTEGSDLTASGWLQVTGGTGDITFGKDATSGVTVTGQLGGTSGNADHTDTRKYTYAGDYGDLVIDGDGDWVYTLGGVANSANAATYQTNIDGLNSAGTETFEVEITRGGEMVDQDIMITVNIAADATPALVVTSQSADTTVTEDDSTDTTATGTLVVTNPPAGATYTYAGTFVGTYGELTIAANGTWTYTINNAAAQALDDGTTEVPIIVTITEVIGGVNGRTDEETITITVNGVDEALPNTLEVASEGVRSHLLIYGVEFRQLVDGANVDGAIDGRIFFPDNPNDVESIISTTTGYFAIRTADFSQANIANLWNTYTSDGNIVTQGLVATIIEEMTTIPAGNTLAGWRTLEVGGAEVTNTNNGNRNFTLGTDDADLVVTEDTDLTASGWLKVTGGMGGDITYGGAMTGTNTPDITDDHIDTRKYTYVGKYGDLVIDGDGDWVYTLGGVANSANAATYRTAIADDLTSAGDTDQFTVTVSETGTTGTEEEMITIVVNGAEAPAAAVTSTADSVDIGASGQLTITSATPGDNSEDTIPEINIVLARDGSAGSAPALTVNNQVAHEISVRVTLASDDTTTDWEDIANLINTGTVDGTGTNSPAEPYVTAVLNDPTTNGGVAIADGDLTTFTTAPAVATTPDTAIIGRNDPFETQLILTAVTPGDGDASATDAIPRIVVQYELHNQNNPNQATSTEKLTLRDGGVFDATAGEVTIDRTGETGRPDITVPEGTIFILLDGRSGSTGATNVELVNFINTGNIQGTTGSANPLAAYVTAALPTTGSDENIAGSSSAISISASNGELIGGLGTPGTNAREAFETGAVLTGGAGTPDAIGFGPLQFTARNPGSNSASTTDDVPEIAVNLARRASGDRNGDGAIVSVTGDAETRTIEVSTPFNFTLVTWGDIRDAIESHAPASGISANDLIIIEERLSVGNISNPLNVQDLLTYTLTGGTNAVTTTEPLFEIAELTVVQDPNPGDANILAGNTVVTNELFQGGDGNDTITTNGGNDVVIGGAGNDTITLGALNAGAETIVYRFTSDGSVWGGADGNDTVDGFEYGVDELVLVDVSDSSPIVDLAAFDDDTARPRISVFTGDGVLTVDALQITFGEGGAVLTINFVGNLPIIDSTATGADASRSIHEHVTQDDGIVRRYELNDGSSLANVLGGDDFVEVGDVSQLPDGLDIL